MTRSLNRGGAERQLINLAKGLAACNWDVAVATFYPGALDKELIDNNIKLYCFEKKGRWDNFIFFYKLLTLARREKPHILHSYLTVGNILAVLLKPFLTSTTIVWGIRSADMDLSRYDWAARVTDRLEKVLACGAALIIVNSQAGYRHLTSRGFPTDKITVIHNGIDTQFFCPDEQARQHMRHSWDIKADEFLIGLIARIDPMKDHPTFLHAAAMVYQAKAKVRFVCVGNGERDYCEEMQTISLALGLSSGLLWITEQKDMRAVYNALDMLVSTSLTEGFSNVIGEAMSCGIPCVVTDVGDSSLIVGNTGVIIAPQDPANLSKSIIKVLQDGDIDKSSVRGRIIEKFSIEALVANTEKALLSLG